jgi:hypothetical protein
MARDDRRQQRQGAALGTEPEKAMETSATSTPGLEPATPDRDIVAAPPSDIAPGDWTARDKGPEVVADAGAEALQPQPAPTAQIAHQLVLAHRDIAGRHGTSDPVCVMLARLVAGPSLTDMPLVLAILELDHMATGARAAIKRALELSAPSPTR